MGHFRKECISFLMTNACNMQCKYCYLGTKHQDSSKVKRIDIEFAKRGLEDFFNTSKSRHIRYFGEGEPTLEIERMQQIQEYAKELAGSKLYTELQTNGLFNQKVADWCLNNLDIIWISMDGIPEVHDYYRPTKIGTPTAETIEKNVRFLAKNGLTVGIRSTIGRKNIDLQKKGIDYFIKLGIKAVFADHLCVPITNGYNKPDNLLVEVNPLEYAKKFLEAREYAEDKGIFYSDFLCVNFDEPVDIACRAMIPAPHLTPSGLVSCCDMATKQTGKLSELIYGKYNQNSKKIEYVQDKINKIRSRKTQNLAECKSCKILKHCAGGCVGEAINETGNFYGIKKNLCKATKYLAERLPLDQGLYKFLHS